MAKKVLVLCIDRDDDIGRKIKRKGPIIGEKENIETAKELIEADPEESDANAIFAAVKTYREIKSDALDVVTLTGHVSRGYKADKIILSQLDEVLKKYKKVDGVILVTDGSDDDQVIPLILSKTKILSKKTVIIKQAKELEKSYYVIKQLLQEPTFARIIFGLPGIIILTIAFLQQLGVQIILFLIGAYLILKGFGIEESILNGFRNFEETTSIERASFPLYIGALLLFLLGLWAGIEDISNYQTILKQSAGFISGFIGLFTLGMLLFLAGRIGDMHYRKEEWKIKKYSMSTVTVLALWLVIQKASELVIGKILVDEFLFWMILTFILSIIGLDIVKKIYTKKYITNRLKKGLEVYNADGDYVGELTEISRKNQAITIKTEEDKKIRVPFTRIALVQPNEFAIVRV